MIIRTVEPADLPQLAGLCRDHAAHEGLDFAEAGQPGRWKQAFFGESPSVFGWVCQAAVAAPLAGYMTATVDYSTWTARPFVYLDCLFLKPSHRGQGLGRRLMAVLDAFAVSAGCATIEWQTPPTNADGLGFYRAIGARELAKVRLHLAASGEVGR